MDVVEVKKLARWLMPGFNRQVALFLLYSLIWHIGMFGIMDVVLNFYFVSLGYGSETIGLLQSLPRIGGLLTGVPVGLIVSDSGASFSFRRWRVSARCCCWSFRRACGYWA